MNTRKISDKITTRERLEEKVFQWRTQGKIVGFTSGSFDILHAGHVDYLEKAKEKCDILIVGVNSDESIRGYKCQKRSILAEELSRVTRVAGLESVDYVFVFNELRNRNNLDILKPDYYYIEAGDCEIDQLTSKDVAEKYGEEVIIIPAEKKISTSEIINKILEFHRDEKIEIEVK
ncbi:MAG TPA: pantoate--beta-alanine ligase [Candidatus Nanoarchaeia archaeon]|nr:pantoate--beta-alanine ligase [Candidatus Nanoarchaeia archaeon]